MRAAARRPVQIGFAFTGMVGLPVGKSPEDIEAARQSTFYVNNRNLWRFTRFTDPIFFKQYPAEGVDLDWISIGSRLDLDWILIGSRLDLDWISIGSRLDLDWTSIGP